MASGTTALSAPAGTPLSSGMGGGGSTDSHNLLQHGLQHVETAASPQPSNGSTSLCSSFVQFEIGNSLV